MAGIIKRRLWGQAQWWGRFLPNLTGFFVQTQSTEIDSSAITKTQTTLSGFDEVDNTNESRESINEQSASELVTGSSSHHASVERYREAQGEPQPRQLMGTAMRTEKQCTASWLSIRIWIFPSVKWVFTQLSPKGIANECWWSFSEWLVHKHSLMASCWG